MTRTAERSQVSPAEYLAWEREQESKHEYFHGEIFAMSGGTPRHNALGVRVGEALRAGIGSRGCEAFSSDQKVGLGNRYVYPDLTVVCGPLTLEPGTTDVITNPSVIVEVLSASTEQYDRGLKWEGYQRVPSLTDYVLVSQAKPFVEHFRRNADGTWTYRAHGPGERVLLTQGAALDVDTLFAGVLELPGD